MNCPYCNRYFSLKQKAIDHMNQFHAAQLEMDQMDAAQSLYFSTHHTLHGICMCGCGKPTEWNYHTGKPYKVRNDPECVARLNRKAKANMVKVYGKETLLNDMKHQEEMQKKRHTYGEYVFPDGGRVGYLSTLEKNFLEFCDHIMEFSSNMIQESPEVFIYHDPKDGKDHQYIPDKYLPDYNLLVEIKDGGDKPNTNPAFIKETKYKVALKDAVMKKQTKYNYIRISGKQYGPFVELLYKISHQETLDKPKQTEKNFVVITESACTDTDELNNFVSVDNEVFHQMYLSTIFDGYTDQIIGIGVRSTEYFDRIYIYNYISNKYQEASENTELFKDVYVYDYKYISSKDIMNQFMKMVIHLTLFPESNDGSIDMLDLLSSYNINFDNGHDLSNNKSHMSDFIYTRRFTVNPNMEEENVYES